ncbi:MAG: S9 family peptidase [Gemmatimonadales bacterium]|nr:MAG: S9 family peptidase [Gemmatimonadales bacterium]
MHPYPCPNRTPRRRSPRPRALGLFLLAAVLFAIPAPGAQAQEASAGQATADQPITVEASLFLPSWGSYELSPDGTRIVFTQTLRDEESYETTSHIHLHDIESGVTRQLTYSENGESNPRWLPDGRILFNSNRDDRNRLWVIDPYGGEATRFIADDDAPNGTLSPDFSRIAFTEESDRADQEEWDKRVENRDDGYYWEHKLTWTHIWVYDIETGTRRQLTTGEFDHSGPTWSPDGEWIAFTSNRTGTQMGDPDRSDNTDILIVPADSGAVRQLTTNPGPDSGPRWSPDGQWIAYTSSDFENNSANQMQVRVIAAQGGEPVTLTTELDRSAGGVQWSHDGEHIYFTATDGLGSRLYRAPAQGGELVDVLPDDEFIYSLQSVSEDGSRWLLTGSSLATPSEVFLSGPDGRDLEHLMSPTDQMAGFEVAQAETLTWEGADGWEIEGVLTYPVGYEVGTRYPLILQVHGGPHGRYSKGFGTGAQVWAARGYAVLQGNPRGSSGRSFEFSNANVGDWGGKDFEDIMAGVDHVIDLGVADPERMAIMGGSYGGFMTFWAVTQTDRFRAAIGHAAISDWFAFYGQTDIPYLLEFGFDGLPWEATETFERWSPIRYVENVTTPLLITHGERDLRVPITQGEQFFRSLKKLGKTTEFLRYPRAGHGISEPRHRIHLDGEQEAWFQTYLLGEAAADASNGGRP